MNLYLQKPILLEQLRDITTSEQVSKNLKKLDKLSLKSEMRPFCLYTGDAEVTEGCSTSGTSDTEHSLHHFTCLIAEEMSEVITTMSRCVGRKGWRIRVVRNGQDALKLMKLRNWDAIFIDDNLPLLCGNTCVSLFRKWETENRIALQRNIYLVSPKFNNNDNVSVPKGYDGVLGTVISQDKIDAVLHAAELVQKNPSPL